VDWLEELRQLPAERRAVQHEPETPRYAKARQKLRYIVREARLLGVQEDPERPGAAWLLAVWAPPDRGIGYGYYACFRAYLDQGRILLAVLYCLYDGTESSPGFKSFDPAKAFAKTQGFHEVPP
jgi:hypothetical protein